jgi:acid stress-induced BolA-like protein IbaG/YrbA
VFSYVISEGLNGKADLDKDGYIKATELANYVDDEVHALVEKVFKKAQYPTVSPGRMGFPIGKVK